MELYLKGETNATKIAKELSLPRKDVLDFIEAWREIARNSPAIKDRAAEAITAMDKHYDLIIKEFWQIIEDGAVTLQVKAGALKSVADVEAKRQDTLFKAGLYDDAGISEELVRMEQYADNIRNVLKETIKQFPMTKTFIMEQLSNLGKVETTDSDGPNPIKGEVID